STWGLARCIDACLQKRPLGILHWSDAGVASWYDFAVAIQGEAGAARLLEKTIRVHAIRTQAYPTPAKRPAFSVLDKSSAMEVLALEPRHWRHELQHVIQEIKAG